VAELKYLFFLGCVIPYRVASYEISARKVAEKLGIELVEMPEFNCCGFPIDSLNHDMMLVLAARNLCLAEQTGLDIMTLCTGCTGVLRKVNKMLKEDRGTRETVNGYLQEIGMEFQGTQNVKHLVQVLAEDVGIKTLDEHVTKRFHGLNGAAHYGCHVLRPEKYIEFGDPEDPRVLKDLIELTGVSYTEYVDERQCCGAPIIGVNNEIPTQLIRDKFHHVTDAGAQVMITICPYCHLMFDANQRRVERTFKETFGLPVLHYSQLLGLALGIPPEDLALKENRVDTEKILQYLQ
jgi:heterodisulfide reductase subunit B